MELDEAKEILKQNGYLLESEPDEPVFQGKLDTHRFGSYPEFEFDYYDEVTDDYVVFYLAADFDGDDDVDIDENIYIDPDKYSQDVIDRVTPLIKKEIDNREYNEVLYNKLMDYYSY